MQNIPSMTTYDILSATGGTFETGRDLKTPEGGFRDLLTEAFQKTARTVQSDKPSRPAKQRRPMEQEAQTQTPADDQSADPAMAAAMVQPEASAQQGEPDGMATEAAGQSQAAAADGQLLAMRNLVFVQASVAAENPVISTTASTTVQSATPTASAMPETGQTENSNAGQGGGIPTMEAAAAQAGEAETNPAAARAQTTGTAAAQSGHSGTAAEEDRFGGMLGQAQQQLRELASQGQPTVQSASVAEESKPELELVEALPAQTEALAEETPRVEEEIPLAEDGQPMGEKLEKPLEEPVEEPREELPEEAMPEEPAHETVSRATTRRQSPVKPTDEQTLTEMPKTDRAVMEMREKTRPAEERRSDQAQSPRETEPERQQPQVKQTAQQPQVRAGQSDQAEQIRVQVQEKLQSGRTEFRMQLQPEELGKVGVRMVIEGGRLAVEIIASGQRAAELLTRQAETLGLTLRNHTGMEVTSIHVVHEASPADGGLDNAFGQSAQTGNNGQEQQSRGGRSGQYGAERDSDSGPMERRESQAPQTLLNATA